MDADNSNSNSGGVGVLDHRRRHNRKMKTTKQKQHQPTNRLIHMFWIVITVFIVICTIINTYVASFFYNSHHGLPSSMTGLMMMGSSHHNSGEHHQQQHHQHQLHYSYYYHNYYSYYYNLGNSVGDRLVRHHKNNTNNMTTVTTAAVAAAAADVSSSPLLLSEQQQQQQQQQQNTRPADRVDAGTTSTTTAATKKKNIRNDADGGAAAPPAAASATTDSQQQLSPRRPYKITPMIRAGKGVVIFLHIAKTGGITIRQQIANQWKQVKTETVASAGGAGATDKQHEEDGADNTDNNNNDTLPLYTKIYYKRFWAPRSFRNFAQPITDMLQGNYHAHKARRRIIFAEFHEYIPSVLQLEPQLRTWRQLAHISNTPFFVFSLVREPISHAVSWFNYFHHPEQKWQELFADNKRFKSVIPMEPNETNLLQVVGQQPNRQFHMLTESSFTSQSQRHFHVNDDVYKQSYERLIDNIDWIGTTEQMSTITMPILTWVLFANTSKAREMPALNVFNTHVAAANYTQPILKKDQLSAPKLKEMQQLTQYDTRFWHEIQQTYTVENCFTNPELAGIAPTAAATTTALK